MSDKYYRGEKLRADDVNAMTSEQIRMSKLSAGRGINLVTGPGGTAIETIETSFLAVVHDGGVIASGSCYCTSGQPWRELQYAGAGTWDVMSGGRVGCAGAFPLQGDPAVSGTRVQLHSANNQDEYWYQTGTGGGGGGIGTVCTRYLDDTTTACVSGEIQVTKTYKYMLLTSGNGPFTSGNCLFSGGM